MGKVHRREEGMTVAFNGCVVVEEELRHWRSYSMSAVRSRYG